MTATAPARTRILDTADRLFYQRGLRAVGVDEIVAESGVAKTTLYAQFGSKDKLIARYLAERSRSLQEFLDRELETMSDRPAEAIVRIFELVERGCDSPHFRGCPFVNFAVEYPDRTLPGWEVCLGYRAWLHDRFASLARAGGAKVAEHLAGQLCLLYDAAMIGSMFEREGRSGNAARRTAAALVRTAFGD